MASTMYQFLKKQSCHSCAATAHILMGIVAAVLPIMDKEEHSTSRRGNAYANSSTVADAVTPPRSKAPFQWCHNSIRRTTRWEPGCLPMIVRVLCIWLAIKSYYQSLPGSYVNPARAMVEMAAATEPQEFSREQDSNGGPSF